MYFLCYTVSMHNWSADERQLKKDKKKYTIWKLEQMVNFGLDGKKIKAADLRKYWSKLRIDPARKKFLSLLLHEKHTHQTSNRAPQGRRKR